MESKVKVIEKNEGRKIDWRQSAAKLTFGDDELTVNVAKYQKDWPVQLDICGDQDGNLVLGAGEGRYYVAQVDIPATKYTGPQPIEPDEAQADSEAGSNGGGGTQQQFTPAEPIPLEMPDVTLTLWALDGLRS